MKIINEEKVNNFLKNYSKDDTIFVFDFDGTITLKGEGSSFDPISNSKTNAQDYMKSIDDYYRIIEKSSSFDEVEKYLVGHDKLLAKSGIQYIDFQDIMMQQWWDLTMLIGIKFHIDIDNYDVSGVEFRSGMKELLDYLLVNNLEFLIVSAGIKNYINNFFIHNNYDLKKLKIIANEFVTDKDGKAIYYDKNLITAFTKQHLNYTNYSLDKKIYAIQLGDSLGDAHIVNDHFEEQNLLKIGFTNGDKGKNSSYEKNFDIVFYEKDESVEDFLDILKIK